MVSFTSIEELQKKASLKLVMTEPVVLPFSPEDMSDIESQGPQSSDANSCQSSGSQDTILLSSQDESETSYRSKPWPSKFEIPPFSYDIDIALEARNLDYDEDDTLYNNPRVTSSKLEKLAEKIFSFTAYPSGLQVIAVAEALVGKYPCLKEAGSFRGLYGLQQRVKYKMVNYLTKLRDCQLAIPELEDNSMNKIRSNEESSPKAGVSN